MKSAHGTDSIPVGCRRNAQCIYIEEKSPVKFDPAYYSGVATSDTPIAFHEVGLGP